MAFISVLIMMGLFHIWLAIVIAGVILLILCVLFSVLYKKNKKSKRWQKIVSILCIICAIPSLLLAGMTFAFLNKPVTEDIKTASGVITVTQEDAYEFLRAISADDVSEAADTLAETPEYKDYITFDGYTILGYAIHENALNVTGFLLEQGLDIDKVNRSGDQSAIALYCDSANTSSFDPDMVNLLLDYQSDVNKTRSVMPPIQYVIELICKDGELNDTEIDLLQRLVDAGADLQAVNGAGRNALEYYKKETKEKKITDSQPEMVEKGLQILRNQ